MRKSILTIGIATAILGFGTAHANHFSYETKAEKVKLIGGMGPTGTNYRGSHSTGTTVTITEDGTKVKGSWECVSMASPDNSKIFDMHMACDVEDSEGTYSVVLGCQMMSEDGSESSCVGGAQGKTGDYKGKNGNFSQHSKDGKSSGSGQWFD